MGQNGPGLCAKLPYAQKHSCTVYIEGGPDLRRPHLRRRWQRGGLQLVRWACHAQDNSCLRTLAQAAGASRRTIFACHHAMNRVHYCTMLQGSAIMHVTKRLRETFHSTGLPPSSSHVCATRDTRQNRYEAIGTERHLPTRRTKKRYGILCCRGREWGPTCARRLCSNEVEMD